MSEQIYRSPEIRITRHSACGVCPQHRYGRSTFISIRSHTSCYPSIVLDVIISSLVTYQLFRARIESSDGTRRLLNKLIAITFEAAVPPTASLLVGLILIWMPVSAPQSSPSLDSLGCALTGTKVYVFHSDSSEPVCAEPTLDSKLVS